MNITNIINNDESVKETSIPKDIKEQLKNLSIDERYNLLNTINREERNEYIRKQQEEVIEEQKKIEQCPLSKQVKLMKQEIHYLQIELETLKNKCNSNLNSNLNKRCPYSFLRLEKNNQDTDEVCDNIEETYSSSCSWWSTIFFIVFFLFIITSKPSKYCNEFVSSL